MSSLATLQRNAMLVGVAAVVASVMGAISARTPFFMGYLQAYGFWIMISLGCLGLSLLHRLVGGRWGIKAQPILETGASLLPLMALLFLPIVVGMSVTYEWSRPEVIEHSPILQTKVAYLNVPFFLVRALLYFIVWTAFAAWLARTFKRKQSNAGIAGLGVLLLAITVSFAAFDWYMSLEPEWFSSMYGGLFVAGSLLTTFSFLVIIAAKYLPSYSADEFHDLGKFLLMSVMLWAYLNFSQYLIIWSAKLPEELTWYHHRSVGGWQYVGLGLVLCHFAIPFCLLLSRRYKRTAGPLVKIAVFLLIMRFIDLWWWVGPSYQPDAAAFPIWAVVAFLAVGGIWLFGFARGLDSRLKAAPANTFVREGQHGPQDRH